MDNVNRQSPLSTLLQISPIGLILGFFLVLPIGTILIVSFWDYNDFSFFPDFVWTNYSDALGSNVTYKTYLNTFWYAGLTWLCTFLIGFTVAYFLAFHIHTTRWQIVLFLICTIPFWTSNIIRMISWIPFLGRNGVFNTMLQSIGLINEPLEFLLFSDFSIVLAFVHLYALFMVVPIFNSMMRIDRSLIEAAIDGGANGWQMLTNVVIPLCKPGIAIGSIFVVTLVMGDYITVRLMGGGQRSSVGVMMWNEISLLLYPAAAAHAVVLLAVVLIMVSLMMQVVDLKKEL